MKDESFSKSLSKSPRNRQKTRNSLASVGNKKTIPEADSSFIKVKNSVVSDQSNMFEIKMGVTGSFDITKATGTESVTDRSITQTDGSKHI